MAKQRYVKSERESALLANKLSSELGEQEFAQPGHSAIKMEGKVEEALGESMVHAHKLRRQITTTDRRVTARSGKKIWKWLNFLLNKFCGFLKYIKCDHTMIAHGWRTFPLFARIEQLDLRRAKTKLEEINGNRSARPSPGSGEKGPQGAAAEVGREEECTIAMSPKRPERRWIRRLTIRVNRKGPHKRRVVDIESEARRARFTRKRRRVARGWVKQQCELTDTRGGTSAGCGRRSSLRYTASYTNGNSSPKLRSPLGSSSDSTALVRYRSRSRSRQKSAPHYEAGEPHLPDELVEKVLAWLPVTSVFRFQTVCKRWQYILSGEGWRKMFHKAPAWNACTSFFSSGKGKRECTFFDDGAQRWSSIDLDFLPRQACRLVAASGGLLCLCFAGVCSCLYICNPMTKSWRELPEFYHKRRRAGTMLVHLLVDKVTCSYKVIVIGHPSCLSPQSDESSSLTEVYDSQTDKWTALANIPSSGCILAPSIAFRNGILYCLTEHPTGLLAFNIARKVWRRLEIKSHSRVLCILEHNGHILIVARLTARVTRFGIWRLRETFPRVWIKVALMPVEHALYFFLSGKFQCFAQGNFICFASPRRPRWLLFHITKRSWKWGTPVRVMDPDNYNKWFFYEPGLDISA